MSARPDLQAFLDRLTSRSALDSEEQQAILDLSGHARQVRAGHDFVLKDERVDHACLIVAGIVGRFDQDSGGARQITSMHIPGDMCDLQSVVRPVSTSALQALSVVTILRIPHSELRRAAGRFPGIAEAFWRDCMVDSAVLAEWVVNVGRRDAKTRVAHLLCEMATRLHVDTGSGCCTFDFPVTQSQLAEATALTAVHVNRTLQSLRTDGLIEWHRRVVRVPGWAALVDRAEFDPAYLLADAGRRQRISIQ